MDKVNRTSIPESEAQLVALLATLRVQPVEEADFESRFLSEFHDRVAREAVCTPARRHLLSHLLQLVDNFGRGRLAFGASALGIVVVGACFALVPAAQVGSDTTATVAHSAAEHAAPLLMPSFDTDLVQCATVHVEQGKTTLVNPGVTVIRGQKATIIEIPANYHTTLHYSTENNRNANRTQLPSSAVRYAF
jgi:hypothetical protein